MKTVYRIERAAPTPVLRPLDITASSLLDFDGSSKLGIWPRDGLVVDASQIPDTLFAFYYLAPGVLVYRDELLTACEDFYWVSREGAELLPLRCRGMSFEAAHCVDFVPPPPASVADIQAPPCLVDGHYSAVLRIEGRPKHDLYCVSGVTGVPLNEFKGVYDHFGFTGLAFTEIWHGEG